MVWADERERNNRWGDSCVSYYQLDVEYFISGLSASLLGVLARDFMWMRTLSATPMLESENRDRLPDRLRAISTKIAAVESTVSAHSSGGRVAGTFVADLTRQSGASAVASARPKGLIDATTSR